MRILNQTMPVSGTPFIATVAYLWVFLGLLLSFAYSSTDREATIGVLMISQAFSGYLAWQRLRHIRCAVFPDFLTIYLFMLCIGKVLTALGLVLPNYLHGSGTTGKYFSNLQSVPFIYQYQSEWVFLLAMAIFTLTWRKMEKGMILAVWREPNPRAMWWIYGLSTLVYLGLIASKVSVIPGETESLIRLFAIGAIAILLGGKSHYALGQKQSWMPISALTPFFILALQSGMKGEVLLVSMPVLLAIIRHLTARRVLFLFGFIIFTLLFVFPFSQTWREANWYANEDIGIKEIAVQVVTKWHQDGLLGTATESTMHLLSRSSTSQQGGLVMQIADRDGLIGPVLIEGLATIYIPRFIWQDKPIYQPGAWFTWYLGNARSPEEARTATAMMLPTELYWMFGIVGVITGMTLLALIYFACWRYLWQLSAVRLVPLCALFALLVRSSKVEEIHTIYAISSPIILIVYVWIIDFIQRMLLPGLSHMAKLRQISWRTFRSASPPSIEKAADIYRFYNNR